MRNLILAVVILLLSSSSAFCQTSTALSDWDSLVEAERAFAKTSVVKGTREAFLAFLADDAVLFRPTAVAGKKWIQEHDGPAGLLTWEPVFAEVAQSGDLGYTTGPWEFRPDRTDSQASGHGHFVSVWRKQPDGSWRVILDLGVTHQPPADQPKGVESPKRSSGKMAKLKSEEGLVAERADLLKFERELGNAMAEKGTARAYLPYLAEDVRLYRVKSFPLTGRREAFAAISQRPGQLTFSPAKADVSKSADLGYTYGTSRFHPEGNREASAISSSYLRIWRKADGHWQIVVDVENPIVATPLERVPQPASQ
jgi:ketosteroid isomerase-like protein